MIFLYILFAIAVIVIIILFVLPSKIHVERSILIKAKVNEVFDQVNELRNWENWSAWHKMDPNQKTEYGETTKGQGGWYKWDSQNKNVGKGKMIIAESIPNEKIVLDLEFEKWGKNKSYYGFEEENDQVRVTMWMENELKGSSKLFGSVMKSNLVKQFDNSLKGIKNICE